MKKKFYQAKCFIAIICLSVIGMTGCALHKEDNTVTNTEVKQELSTEEQFVEDVKVTLQKYIDNYSKEEKLTDVYFANGELWICLDVSSVNTTLLPIDHFAIQETGFLTDYILALNEYTNLWDIIIVKYEDVGYIKLDKSIWEKKADGQYYFPTLNMELITE